MTARIENPGCKFLEAHRDLQNLRSAGGYLDLVGPVECIHGIHCGGLIACKKKRKKDSDEDNRPADIGPIHCCPIEMLD
jgi:hypothetical protein